MVEMIWQDPPERMGERRKFYAACIENLKKNPGKWALITSDWKTSSAPAPFRQAGCQATARRNEGKTTWSVYARFPLLRQRATDTPTPTVNPEKAKVRQAIQAGTALTPPPAAPKRQAPPAPEVKPANDFGISAFRAARAARGVPPEGKH